MGSEVETALREHRCTLNKFFGVAYNLDVAFHVFVRPTTRMGDIGELRKNKTELREEPQHLTCDRLDIVLTANNNKSRHFVANKNLIADCHSILYAI